ncbi:MAG: ribosome maturation factor RimM [Chloroflexota bacterium]
MTTKEEQIYIYRNRQVHIPDGHLAVGYIAGVHGLNGELKVEPHTDFPERFDAGNTLALGESLQPVFIEASRVHKGHILLKLKGIKTRSQADGLRNGWLFIHEENAGELEDGTYWIHDIIGLTMQSEDGTQLGTVTDVVATGANDVYVVRPTGTINKGRELLIPAIDDVIMKVDIGENLIIVRLPQGLIEE